MISVEMTGDNLPLPHDFRRNDWQVPGHFDRSEAKGEIFLTNLFLITNIRFHFLKHRIIANDNPECIHVANRPFAIAVVANVFHCFIVQVGMLQERFEFGCVYIYCQDK